MILWTFTLASRAANERVDFNFEVRPILSDRCFFCHGPDEKARKAKLRLDQHADILQSRTNGTVVVKAGDPDASELVKRIFSTDPEEVMPPPESHLELNAAEKDILR
ncbi:MAG TPA: chromosome segregation protein, partial [Verrucomicrobiota bacterium]|nr:chromosome segregation protein [Verrucomicrobiota bacterium]